MRKKSLVWILGLAFILLPLLLRADGTLLGTISGKVVDEHSTGLPGATVELTSEDRGFGRTMPTDAGGTYKFALLQPGPYTIKITLPSFEIFISKKNMVEPDKTTTVDATLRIARVAESVVVSGETPLVDKTNTSDTTVVSSQLTERLPVARGYQNLIPFAPGVDESKSVMEIPTPTARCGAITSFSLTASTRPT